MLLRFRQRLPILAFLACGSLPLMPQTVPGGDHIVPSTDLHQAVRTAAHEREDNVAKLDRFFSSQPARKALETFKLDSTKISQSLAFLNDEELARLAAQSEKLRSDVEAGSLSNQQITYILIALATAVIILVIVAAR